METGKPGLAGEPAVLLADLEVRYDREFATILRHQMEELTAVNQHQRVKPAMQLIVMLVGIYSSFDLYLKAHW